MKIAVIGPQNFNDYEKFQKIINEFLKSYENVEFISGGQKELIV